MTEKIDFLTDFQRKRVERRNKILTLWEKLRKEAPESVSNNRIKAIIAEEMGITTQAVYLCLSKYGKRSDKEVKA